MNDSKKLKALIVDRALSNMCPSKCPPNDRQRDAIYSRLIVATYGAKIKGVE